MYFSSIFALEKKRYEYSRNLFLFMRTLCCPKTCRWTKTSRRDKPKKFVYIRFCFSVGLPSGFFDPVVPIVDLAAEPLDLDGGRSRSGILVAPCWRT